MGILTVARGELGNNDVSAGNVRLVNEPSTREGERDRWTSVNHFAERAVKRDHSDEVTHSLKAMANRATKLKGMSGEESLPIYIYIYSGTYHAATRMRWRAEL